MVSLCKQSFRAERSCRAIRMVVRSTTTESRQAGDQAEQTYQRSEGAEWINAEPNKAELLMQANLPNWAQVVLYCGFTG